MAKMNLKQDRFCTEYVKDLNATQAAIRTGYSAKTAYSQGQRLLKNVEVKKKVAKLLSRGVKTAELSLSAVMTELKQIAFATMADFAKWGKKGVTLKPSAELCRDLQKAVESVAETSDKLGQAQVKIKLHSKLRAIEAILRLYEISEIEARIAVLEEKRK